MTRDGLDLWDGAGLGLTALSTIPTFIPSTSVKIEPFCLAASAVLRPHLGRMQELSTKHIVVVQLFKKADGRISDQGSEALGPPGPLRAIMAERIICTLPTLCPELALDGWWLSATHLAPLPSLDTPGFAPSP